MLSRAGFILQFSHTGHVSRRVPGRVGRQLLRLPSCLEPLRGGGRAVPSPGVTSAGWRACTLISMAVSSGNWIWGGRSGVGGGGSGNEDMFYSCPYFSPGKPTSNAGSLKVFAFIWNTQTPLKSFFIFLFHLTPTH